MKKPFRKLADGLTAFLHEQFPKPLTPEQLEAQYDAKFEAEKAERLASALKERLAYAQRIAPFIGKLFLLTDFGPPEGDWPQHITRTADALGSAGLTSSMRVGTSVHLGQIRGTKGQGWQRDTQTSIRAELQDRGYGTMLRSKTQQHDLIDSLLRTLVLAAEYTRDTQPEHQPSDFGHIAVVAAGELGDIDVRGIPRDGSLFMLQGVDTEQGRLHWQMIATEPPTLYN